MRSRGQEWYPGSGRERNRSWELLRGVGMLLALALASFALGFFVLARLPRFRQAGTSTIRDAAPASVEANRVVPAERTVAPSQETEAPFRPSVPSPPPGPTIDPEEPQTLQPPEPLDSSRAGLEGEGRPALPPSSGGVTSEVQGAATQMPGASADIGRKNSRSRDAVQTPGTPDEGRSGASSTSVEENPSDASADNPSSGLYRVQVGVYSTREAAEKEARALSARGIETVVQTASINGRTLYRLQYGAYRHRANAEAARERLGAAGIESVVQGPEVAHSRP